MCNTRFAVVPMLKQSGYWPIDPVAIGNALNTSVNRVELQRTLDSVQCMLDKITKPSSSD